jgi:hypothetical protein
LRKLFIGALVGALALVVAAIAAAATEQTFRLSFNTKTAGKSSGIAAVLEGSDPANSANNGQPKPSRQVDIKLPSGTAFNYKAAPVCTKSNDEIIQAGGKPACPKAVVGAGSAKVKLPFPGSADVNATVTAFNAKNVLILYVDPSPVAQPIVLRSKWTGNLKRAPVLKTPVPPNCLPPATNQGGQCKKQDGSAGQEAILSHLDLKTVRKKKGKAVLIRTPKKCKGTWKGSVTFHYSDGTTETVNSLQPCRKT